MNCKNVDKTDFPEENSSLDDSEKRFHTAKDSLLYIKCPRNRDIFIKTCKTAKKCAGNKVKRQTLVSNRNKYTNNLKASAEFEIETNLCTEKGTYIQKVKSRRKIKSSKNDYITNSHNKKLDPKSEEKCLDKNHEDICDKNNNSISNRIKYPNYLKTNSRLKERNDLRPLSNNDNKVKSKSEHGDENVSSDNCYLLIKDRQIVLQTIIEENEKSKNKLKTFIESLREILDNYDETEDEIKLLKCDSSCEKKQTKCPNDHLTFGLMNQCGTVKNIDAYKKSNQRTDVQTLGCQMVPLKDALNISACKCALEITKVQDTKQRLIELERQNRMIIRSLDELKSSLRKTNKLQFTEVKSPTNKNLHYRTANRIRTSNFSKSVELPATVQRKTTASNKSSVPFKKQPEMLREMIKFSKLVKNKEHLIKDNQHIKHQENPAENGDSVQRKQILRNLNVFMKSKQDCSPPLASNKDIKINTEASGVQKKNICKKKFCKMTNRVSSQKQQTKRKEEIHKHQVLDQSQFKSMGKINKVRQPASSKIKAQYPPRTLAHRNSYLKKIPCPETNSRNTGSHRHGRHPDPPQAKL